MKFKTEPWEEEVQIKEMLERLQQWQKGSPRFNIEATQSPPYLSRGGGLDIGSHGIPLMTFCLYTMILVLVCLDFIMIYFYLDSQGNGFSHATCFWMTIYVL
jgi:hypothetical protein